MSVCIRQISFLKGIYQQKSRILTKYANSYSHSPQGFPQPQLHDFLVKFTYLLPVLEILDDLLRNKNIAYSAIQKSVNIPYKIKLQEKHHTPAILFIMLRQESILWHRHSAPCLRYSRQGTRNMPGSRSWQRYRHIEKGAA